MLGALREVRSEQAVAGWPQLSEALSPRFYRMALMEGLHIADLETRGLNVIGSTAFQGPTAGVNAGMPANREWTMADLTRAERIDYVDMLRRLQPTDREVQKRLAQALATRVQDTMQLVFERYQHYKEPTKRGKNYRLILLFQALNQHLQTHMPLVVRKLTGLATAPGRLQVLYVHDALQMFSIIYHGVVTVFEIDIRFSAPFREAQAVPACRGPLQQFIDAYNVLTARVAAMRRDPLFKRALRTLPREGAMTFDGVVSSWPYSSASAAVAMFLDFDTSPIANIGAGEASTSRDANAGAYNVARNMERWGLEEEKEEGASRQTKKKKGKGKRKAALPPPARPLPPLTSAANTALIRMSEGRRQAEAVQEALEDEAGEGWIDVVEGGRGSQAGPSSSRHRPGAGLGAAALAIQTDIEKYYRPTLFERNAVPDSQYHPFTIKRGGSVAVSRHRNRNRNDILPHATISHSNLPHGYHITVGRVYRDHYYFDRHGVLIHSRVYDEASGGMDRHKGPLPANIHQLSTRVRNHLAFHRRNATP